MTDPNGCPTVIPTILDLDDPKTPCGKASQGSLKAKILLQETEIQNRVTTATASMATDTLEKGFNFGTTSNGSYTGSSVQTGNGSAVDLPHTDPNFTVTGSVHTHPIDNFDNYSAADCYGFIFAKQNNANFSTIFVFGATGAVYNMTITDPVKFNNFKTNYPKADYLGEDGHWKEGSDIRADFEEVFKQFGKQGKSEDEAYALAQAYVLRKYNAGMSFSKKDTDGNFKTIFVKETQDTNDSSKTTYEQTLDCNL